MGQLTTHVLDTARGKPGDGIAVELYLLHPQERLVKSVRTNANGRTDEPLLGDEAFAAGPWELRFHVAEYFAAAGFQQASPPFLDTINIRFAMAENEHYHVPLLVSPWSYSTYRGS